MVVNSGRRFFSAFSAAFLSGLGGLRFCLSLLPPRSRGAPAAKPERHQTLQSFILPVLPEVP